LKPPLSPALGAVVRAYINYGIRPTGEMLENLMSYDGPIRWGVIYADEKSLRA